MDIVLIGRGSGDSAKTLIDSQYMEIYPYFKNHDVSVNYIIPHTINNINPSSLEEMFFSIEAVSQINRLQKLKNVDIMHFHSTEALLTSQINRKLSNKPRIIEIGTPVFAFNKFNKINISKTIISNISEMLTMGACRCSDLIIATSEVVKKDLLQHMDICEEKIHIVTIGVNIDIFKPTTNKIDIALQDKQEIIIINIGSVSKSKNQSMLVDAGLILIKKYKSIKFLFIGPILDLVEYRKIENKIAKNNASSHFSFVGKVNHYDLPKWINIADIAVFPSLIEGGPSRSLLEAMSSGCPCISHTMDFNKEVLHNRNEFQIYDYNDVKSLVNSIEKLLLDDTLRNKFAINGRKTIVEHFSPNVVVDNLLKIYNGLI